MNKKVRRASQKHRKNRQRLKRKSKALRSGAKTKMGT